MCVLKGNHLPFCGNTDLIFPGEKKNVIFLGTIEPIINNELSPMIKR